jgi:DNA-binding LacI/PurR family transcriptional regulator
MPSIQQVAAACGVSTATVSKVINGRAGVNAQTAQRVRLMMDQMDFVPQSKAVDPNRILVALPNHRRSLLHPYPAAILAGITENAFGQSVSLSLKACPAEAPDGQQICQMVREDASRGVILIAARAGYEWADRLVIEKLPHVIVGSSQHDLNVNQVVMDDRNSAARAVDFLATLGHRNIQMVTFKRDDVVHADRYQGYLDAIAGLPDSQTVNLAGYQADVASVQMGEKLMHEIWDSSSRPTALIVTNETLAMGLVHEARRMGIKVPEQLSILAYESQNLLASVDPPITSMVSPAYEMGQAAFDLLNKQLANHSQVRRGDRMSVQTRQMQHTLVVRQTTVGPA